MAITPDIENDAGKYFQNCSTFCTNSQVTNTDVQKKLWEASCKATGWTDSINTAKPKVAPNRKNTPAIVITKDSGTESISSVKSKMTKDDLEKEEDNGNGNNARQSVSSTTSSTASEDAKSNAAPNKIQVKISEKSGVEVSSTTASNGNGVANAETIPTSVGGNE